jgi:riboflavin kinase / FMN adenylyltransferase
VNISTTLKNSTSIAIGGFDGMHIGHQKLFEALDDQSGAIVVIETGHATMTHGVLRQKYSDYPIHIYELAKIKHLDDKAFIEKLIEDFPKLKKIVVGYDFHFGKDRAYSSDDLKKHFDGDVVVIDEVKHRDASVHSHVIRALLRDGDLKLAKELLGRDYTIEGCVVKGQGLGKKELFATLNIHTTQLLPKEGVYVSLSRINDEVAFHPSVTFLGHRLTTDGKMAIETHLLNGSEIEVDNLEIAFVSFLRDNQKFDDLKDLKEAIASDIKKARGELKHLAL